VETASLLGAHASDKISTIAQLRVECAGEGGLLSAAPADGTVWEVMSEPRRRDVRRARAHRGLRDREDG
jgi:hypothetical protein